MASSLRSSVGSGMALSRISKVAEPRTSRLHLRVVSESASTAMRGGGRSEGSVCRKPDGEVAKLIGKATDKQGHHWWGPLFNVSTEEQWSDLLLTKKTTTEAGQTNMRSSPPVQSIRSSAAAPERVDSHANGSTRPDSARVAFTAEKARALRRSMRASETWHDGWYHSAIASRLAEPTD